MKHILLASHGYMAKGLKNTLSIFSNEADNIIIACAYIDDSCDYLKVIKDFIHSNSAEDSIIFTDIYGGSVNTKIIEEMMLQEKNIPIIAGMNLPLVLSVLLFEENLNRENIKKIIAECTPVLVEIQTDTEGKISQEEEENDFLE